MTTNAYRIRIVFYLIAIGLLGWMAYRQVKPDRFAVEFSEVLELVEASYVEPVERRELFEDAMIGLTARLDLHSTYIAPDAAKQLDVILEREYAGVGMTVEKRSLGGPLIVLSPFFSTPAYQAGIRAGDAIHEIDGISTLGMPRSDAVMRIRGEVGAPVRLRLRHAGEQEMVETAITRERISLPSLIGDARRADGSWDFHLQEDPRIAYVRLVSFGRRSSDELKEVLAPGATPSFQAMILDLRDNAGGHLQAAVEICDMFLDRGVIVTTRDREGAIREQFAAGASPPIPPEIPLTILVNKYSASSSEIVSACLQDHDRAVVIGERTWGKGSVQKVFRLKESGGALKLTVATYWRPSGENIQRGRTMDEDDVWGVQPNSGFEVVLSDEQAREIWLQRRWRDVPQSETDQPQVDEAQSPVESSSPPNDPVPKGESPQSEQDMPGRVSPSTTPIDDPVLRRAIDFLQSKLAPSPSLAARR